MPAFLMNAFSVCLGVSVLAGAFLLIRPRLARKYTAKWRCLVFLLLALRLLVPIQVEGTALRLTVPLPQKEVHLRAPLAQAVLQGGQAAGAQTNATQTEQPAQNTQMPSQPMEQQGQIAPIEQSAQTLPQAQTEHLQQSAISLTVAQLAAMVWISVAAAWCTLGTGAYLITRRRILKTSAPTVQPQQMCDTLRAELKIRRYIPVRQSKKVAGPMLMGALCPCIVLPSELAPSIELALILRHELEHYRRKDVLCKLLFSLVCWLYWFNPVFWLMRAAAEADVEQACDEAVIAGRDGAFRLAYSQSIVHALRPVSHMAGSTAFSGGKNTIKRRIIEIFNTNCKKTGKAALAVMLALTVLAGTLVACTNPSAQQSQSEELAFQFEVPARARQLVELAETYSYSDFVNPANEQAQSAGQTEQQIASNWEWNTRQVGQALALGYVLVRGTADAYVEEEDSYTLAGEEMYELIDAMVAEPELSDEVLKSSFAIHFDKESYSSRVCDRELELYDAATLENGDLRLSYHRTSTKDGCPLDDVIYQLRPVVADPVPVLMEGDVAQGETYYALVSLQNLPFVATEETDEEKTVEISTAEQLYELAESYAKEGWKYAGYTYLLTSDIDLGGKGFPGIGSYLAPNQSNAPSGFNATFDGQGHTITGLLVNAESAPDVAQRGLFSVIGPNGTVKNLKIADAKIEGVSGAEQTLASSARASGILAGRCSGRIENCEVTGTVTGEYSCGGLVGELTYWWERMSDLQDPHRGAAENCTVNVTVSGAQNVGAFAGMVLASDVRGCTAKGTVIGNPGNDSQNGFTYPACIGGFSGFNNGAAFVDCTVESSLVINASGQWIGYALGNLDGNGLIVKFSYNAARKGNWQLIDVVDGVDPTEEVLRQFEFVPLS